MKQQDEIHNELFPFFVVSFVFVYDSDVLQPLLNTKTMHLTED